MANSADLRSEIAQLRQELEEHRRSETERLRSELAAALEAAAHYRAEAQRNADVGRAILAEMTAKVNKLEAQIKTAQQLPNGRPKFTR